MNFECLGTFVFVGSGHVGVSMFTHESCDKFMKFDFFLWKIIHIEPLADKGRSPFNGKLSDFSSCILIAKYLFTGSLKKIDQLIFRNTKEIYFNEKFPIL